MAQKRDLRSAVRRESKPLNSGPRLLGSAAGSLGLGGAVPCDKPPRPSCVAETLWQTQSPRTVPAVVQLSDVTALLGVTRSPVRFDGK